MPYARNSELPEEVKALPAHGQVIYRRVFNCALLTHSGDEGKADLTAWRVVRRDYKMVDDLWVPKKTRTFNKVADFFHNFEHDPEGLTHCKGQGNHPYTIRHFSGEHIISNKFAQGYGRGNEPQWFEFLKRLGNGWALESGEEIKMPPNEENIERIMSLAPESAVGRDERIEKDKRKLPCVGIGSTTHLVLGK